MQRNDYPDSRERPLVEEKKQRSKFFHPNEHFPGQSNVSEYVESSHLCDSGGHDSAVSPSERNSQAFTNRSTIMFDLDVIKSLRLNSRFGRCEFWRFPKHLASCCRVSLSSRPIRRSSGVLASQTRTESFTEQATTEPQWSMDAVVDGNW